MLNWFVRLKNDFSCTTPHLFAQQHKHDQKPISGRNETNPCTKTKFRCKKSILIDGTIHFMLLENKFACAMLLLRLVMIILSPENDFTSKNANSTRKRRHPQAQSSNPQAQARMRRALGAALARGGRGQPKPFSWHWELVLGHRRLICGVLEMNFRALLTSGTATYHHAWTIPWGWIWALPLSPALSPQVPTPPGTPG